jgi:hypothetical protein
VISRSSGLQAQGFSLAFASRRGGGGFTLPSRCSFVLRWISRLRYHVTDRINNHAGSFPSDSMLAVLHDNLTSLGQKLRELHLQLVRPDLMKGLSSSSACGSPTAKPAPRRHNQWTTAKITRDVRFGRTLCPCIAHRGSDK